MMKILEELWKKFKHKHTWEFVKTDIRTPHDEIYECVDCLKIKTRPNNIN
ncbi:hypothetical protein LCGC14_0854980 [marine sediment metagenome]|uniref:Uncharacterized protein n=1 Tax=marine sediment metagenome TaxID=412755 RepID=A0A0F9PUF1_9ZZZZ